MNAGDAGFSHRENININIDWVSDVTYLFSIPVKDIG